MTTQEALDGQPVTTEEARREVERHNLEWDSFVEECGERQEYSSTVIMAWLGY